MNIKRFIKRYPITIVFTLILSISIMTIIIQGKVYASSDAKSDTDCFCNMIHCSEEEENDVVNCNFDTDSRKCSCEKNSLCVCDNSYRELCGPKDLSVIPLPQCCNCDCDPGCSPLSCNCKKYIPRAAFPCSGSGLENGDDFTPAYCGACEFNKEKTYSCGDTLEK